LAGIQAAAVNAGQQIRVFNTSTDAQVSAAFTTIVELRVGALFVPADAYFTNSRDRLVALAARHAVPTSYPFREFVVAGGLMSYGPDLSDASYKVGLYAGRILGGTKPADLPVMQPTKFEFMLNLKTAKALGLTVPPTLLARADEVIE
jgi:putative ABC transport system substrate-binding protein